MSPQVEETDSPSVTKRHRLISCKQLRHRITLASVYQYLSNILGQYTKFNLTGHPENGYNSEKMEPKA